MKDIHGWGEASNSPGGGCFLSARTIELLRQSLVGQDPFQSEKVWQQNYRRFTYLGARGLPTVALSGVDMALWGYQGEGPGPPGLRPAGRQAAGQHPALRQRLVLRLQHPRAVRCGRQGHRRSRAMRPSSWIPSWRCSPSTPAISQVRFQPRGRTWAAPSCRRFGRPWETKVEILIDAHGHYNVPTAIRLANRLYDESQIAWFEEPGAPRKHRRPAGRSEST